MADIIDWKTRAAPVEAEKPLEVSEPLKDGDTDVDSVRMLDFYAQLAKEGEVAGCLIIVFNPKTKRYSHAFSAPLGEDASNGALQMAGAMNMARDDVMAFARATGDYGTFAQVSELTDLVVDPT